MTSGVGTEVEGKLRTTILDHAIAIGAGDAFLICTDGFWELVTEVEMEAMLAGSNAPEQWLARMESILLDNAPPDHDNYTATAIFVE